MVEIWVGELTWVWRRGAIERVPANGHVVAPLQKRGTNCPKGFPWVEANEGSRGVRVPKNVATICDAFLGNFD